MNSPALPPLSYLLECSNQSLADLELAALARSSQHLKRAKEEWLEGASQREAAGVARWLIENREGLLEQARKTVEVESAVVFPERKRA